MAALVFTDRTALVGEGEEVGHRLGIGIEQVIIQQVEKVDALDLAQVLEREAAFTGGLDSG